jgi:hypothetical protein
VAKFAHQRDVVKNPDVMRGAHSLNRHVLKGLIASTKNIRLASNGRLDDRIVIWIDDNSRNHGKSTTIPAA